MPKTSTRPAGWLPTLMLVLGSASPLLAQVLERPPIGYRTPTVVRAGPTLLKVAALVPTRLDLSWTGVTGAWTYRITRSSSADPTQFAFEVPGDLNAAGDAFYFDNLPSRSGGVTFTYTINAVFVEADASKTLSAPSPTMNAKALIPTPPPRFKSRIGMSKLMGRLQVTFDWGKVDGAWGYELFQVTRLGVIPLPMLTTKVRGTSYTVDNVVPGQGGTVCAITVWEEFLKDDSSRSCELVLTPAR